MNTINFDWRLIFVILIVVYVLVASPYSETATNVVIAAIGAGWALQSGLAPWRGGRSVLGSTKVTYWRGQRIVTKQPARARIRSFSNIQMLVSIAYIVLGLGMTYAAIIKFVRLVGIGI